MSLIVASAAWLLAAPKVSFELGVLRRDGIMIPFAAYSGHDWSAPWPPSDTSAPLPIGLGDVPKKWWGPAEPGAAWTAWMLADGSSRPLKLEKPQQVRVFCGGHIGLKTDYPGEPIDEREPSVAKDALVVGGSGAVPVQPIIQVSVLAQAVSGEIVKTIAEQFNKEETLAAASFTNWWHPYSTEQREAIPIELEAIYRFREKTVRDGEWVATYVEAIRRYPAGPRDRDCGLITWGNGWIIEREGKKPEIHLTAKVTYCDREGVSFMQPLGHLSVDGDNYWVYQMSSWRDEVYTVARMRPDEVRPILHVFGGECPKAPVK
ncbi:MAG TPA: hypothetical protein VKT77_18060 [Chthonomonadaceae bacterium]|nr:hypothetical protein [Chthonomonadaceae bacterium]